MQKVYAISSPSVSSKINLLKQDNTARGPRRHQRMSHVRAGRLAPSSGLWPRWPL